MVLAVANDVVPLAWTVWLPEAPAVAVGMSPQEQLNVPSGLAVALHTTTDFGSGLESPVL